MVNVDSLDAVELAQQRRKSSIKSSEPGDDASGPRERVQSAEVMYVENAEFQMEQGEDADELDKLMAWQRKGELRSASRCIRDKTVATFRDGQVRVSRTSPWFCPCGTTQTAVAYEDINVFFYARPAIGIFRHIFSWFFGICMGVIVIWWEEPDFWKAFSDKWIYGLIAWLGSTILCSTVFFFLRWKAVGLTTLLPGSRSGGNLGSDYINTGLQFYTRRAAGADVDKEIMEAEQIIRDYQQSAINQISATNRLNEWEMKGASNIFLKWFQCSRTYRIELYNDRLVMYNWRKLCPFNKPRASVPLKNIIAMSYSRPPVRCYHMSSIVMFVICLAAGAGAGFQFQPPDFSGVSFTDAQSFAKLVEGDQMMKWALFVGLWLGGFILLRIIIISCRPRRLWFVVRDFDDQSMFMAYTHTAKCEQIIKEVQKAWKGHTLRDSMVDDSEQEIYQCKIVKGLTLKDDYIEKHTSKRCCLCFCCCDYHENNYAPISETVACRTALQPLSWWFAIFIPVNVALITLFTYWILFPAIIAPLVGGSDIRMSMPDNYVNPMEWIYMVQTAISAPRDDWELWASLGGAGGLVLFEFLFEFICCRRRSVFLSVLDNPAPSLFEYQTGWNKCCCGGGQLKSGELEDQLHVMRAKVRYSKREGLSGYCGYAYQGDENAQAEDDRQIGPTRRPSMVMSREDDDGGHKRIDTGDVNAFLQQQLATNPEAILAANDEKDPIDDDFGNRTDSREQPGYADGDAEGPGMDEGPEMIAQRPAIGRSASGKPLPPGAVALPGFHSAATARKSLASPGQDEQDTHSQWDSHRDDYAPGMPGAQNDVTYVNARESFGVQRARQSSQPGMRDHYSYSQPKSHPNANQL